MVLSTIAAFVFQHGPSGRTRCAFASRHRSPGRPRRTRFPRPWYILSLEPAGARGGDTHITRPWPEPGPAHLYQSFPARPPAPVATPPPGPLRGRGRRPSGAVGRRPSVRPNRNTLKVKEPPLRTAQTVMGDPSPVFRPPLVSSLS